MDKVLGDQKNVNFIPLFLYVSPCSLYYYHFKTQGSEVEPEPVFWVHGDWRCQGSFKSGGTLRALFLVFLWAAKRVSWGILSGPGQREAEAFFSFSLYSVGNLMVQVSEKTAFVNPRLFWRKCPNTFPGHSCQEQYLFLELEKDFCLDNLFLLLPLWTVMLRKLVLPSSSMSYSGYPRSSCHHYERPSQVAWTKWFSNI